MNMIRSRRLSTSFFLIQQIWPTSFFEAFWAQLNNFQAEVSNKSFRSHENALGIGFLHDWNFAHHLLGLITGICKWLVAVADVFLNISYIVFAYICNYVYHYLRISAVNVGFNRSTPCEIFVLKQSQPLSVSFWKTVCFNLFWIPDCRRLDLYVHIFNIIIRGLIHIIYRHYSYTTPILWLGILM